MIQRLFGIVLLVAFLFMGSSVGASERYLPPAAETSLFTEPEQWQVIEAVCRIQSVQNGKGQYGSGVVVSSRENRKRRGFVLSILTAKHVVQDATDLSVAFFTQRNYPTPAMVFGRAARVVAMAADCDLALVEIESDWQPPSVIALCPPVDDPLGPTPIMLVGCGGSMSPRARIGKNVHTDRPMVLSEVAGIPGDSGSPIVARVDGKLVVIGIVSTTDGRWTWSCNSSSFVQFLSQKAPDVIDDQPNRGAFDLIPFPFLLVVLAGIGIVVLFMAGKK